MPARSKARSKKRLARKAGKNAAHRSKGKKINKKAITARLKKAAISSFNNQPQVILGKAAYKQYNKLTPAQKQVVNRLALQAAVALI